MPPVTTGCAPSNLALPQPGAASTWRWFNSAPSRSRRGPGLGTGSSEVAALAAEYGGSTVLGDGTATAARVLEAIDGALLVHIAADGTFRSDSPLFSSLRMDDGPLTVRDSEWLAGALSPRPAVLRLGPASRG